MTFLNVSWAKHGGIRFVKVGRLFFSFGLAREYRPIGGRR